MRIMKMSVGLVSVVVAAAACQGSPAPQVVSGTVALSSFPTPVAVARAVQAGRPVVESPVAADGGFSLTIPAGRGYRIEFAASSGGPALVFPRHAGGVTASFDVRGNGAPFDLGAVRYIGDPASWTFAFASTTPGDTDTLQCEDGIDLATGAACVDDGAEELGGQCEEGDGEGGDHECVDGIDPATGAWCDGGPAANPANDPTETGCSDGVDPVTGLPCVAGDEEGLPSEAAVADHNLPASIGCGDGEDD